MTLPEIQQKYGGYGALTFNSSSKPALARHSFKSVRLLQYSTHVNLNLEIDVGHTCAEPLT